MQKKPQKNQNIFFYSILVHKGIKKKDDENDEESKLIGKMYKIYLTLQTFSQTK